ncbi:MAG: hypothetical protein A2080_09530 [Ignavibacteria bacterium GWC2_36_12]|nr:MAG: hypothetical protein A2080_09530 [Ignavibacteria bacterium GWC2_36_12]
MKKYFSVLIVFIININSYPGIKALHDTLLVSEDSLKAKEVIDNYVAAIGGADKIYNIMDRTTIMTGSIQGINVTIISYQKAPNKFKQQIKAGNTKQVIIFDGEKGMMSLAGEKVQVTGGELEKLKFESTLTLLTDIEHYGIKLTFDGTEKIESEDAYKIILTLPSGIKWTQYYDTASGLKLKELKYIQSESGLFEQEITYDDYREVGGLLYPFKIKQSIGTQTMEFIVNSIEINTGLVDREFEIN